MAHSSIKRPTMMEGIVADAISGFNSLEAVKGEPKKFEGGVWMAEQFVIALSRRMGSKDADEACAEIIKTIKPV